MLAAGAMRRMLLLVAVTAAAVAIVVVVSAGGSTSAKNENPPFPSPDRFVARVTNPWFPLKPGTVFTSRGEEDGDQVRDVFTVTHRTKTILGVKATVIDDRVYTNGKLEERTTDWYAQDADGNVWYLGEATATLKENGKVESRGGSWQAGVDGAKAGIFMPAHPRVGQTGQQEVYKGHAEDQFKVLSLTNRITTPAVSSKKALLTQETTPLEKGVVDHKVYVRGYGTVAEKTVKGGNEQLELVSVKRP
jgi:hypothetical protein